MSSNSSANCRKRVSKYTLGFVAKIAATRVVTEQERREASFGAILKRVRDFFGLG